MECLAKTDPSFANLLLAEYEKNRAREVNEQIDLIDKPEYQHFLATYGNPSLNNCAEELAHRERQLQLACDTYVITNRKRDFPSSAEATVRNLSIFSSSKVIYRYVNASRAHSELEARCRTVKEENARLQKEIMRLQTRGVGGKPSGQ
jgi:hypothetical protein